MISLEEKRQRKTCRLWINIQRSSSKIPNRRSALGENEKYFGFCLGF